MPDNLGYQHEPGHIMRERVPTSRESTRLNSTDYGENIEPNKGGNSRRNTRKYSGSSQVDKPYFEGGPIPKLPFLSGSRTYLSDVGTFSNYSTKESTTSSK